MNTSLYGDFQICISVPLKTFEELRLESHGMCGSWRRADFLVEHLTNKRKIYHKVTKEKYQMIFSHMVSFYNTGG